MGMGDDAVFQADMNQEWERDSGGFSGLCSFFSNGASSAYLYPPSINQGKQLLLLEIK